MPVDRKFIGYQFEPSEKEVTHCEISQFANAIREKNQIYFDLDVAKNAGYRNIPVPPTYFTKITFSGGFFEFFQTLGIDFRKLLDGGREYIYYGQCCAGDTLVYQTNVKDIIEREGSRGKMDIVTAVTSVKNKQNDEKIVDTIITLIVFH